MMTIFGLTISYFNQHNISLEFMRYVQPIAVGLVWYAALRITTMVVNTRTGFALMVISPSRHVKVILNL